MIILVYYPDMSSHLALGLTGLGREKNIYISFFPGNERSIAGFRLHELDHDRFMTSTISNSPVHRGALIINLPTEESCGFGLSEQAVYDWWKQLKPAQESFGWFTNNCSSIIYRALHQAQLGARTLNHKPLAEKSWFCTPSNVMSYAINIASKLRDQATFDENLIFQYVELANLCELGCLKHTYSQFQALYVRIKQFTHNKNYKGILDQKFTEAMQDVICEFHNTFATAPLFKKIDESLDDSHPKQAKAGKGKTLTREPIDDDEDLSEESDEDSCENSSRPERVCAPIREPIDEDYDQLNDIYVNLLEDKDASLTRKLETLIANKILAPMANYINQFLPRIDDNKLTIEHTLQEAANVIDAKNNPKKVYVQKGDAIPIEFRNMSRS